MPPKNAGILIVIIIVLALTLTMYWCVSVYEYVGMHVCMSVCVNV